MRYFEFYNEHGPHRISSTEAQELLQVSKRTIQHYYDPDRRDPGRWAYLEAYATGRIIPDNWDIRIRDDYVYSSTGYRFMHWELSQVAHAHSVKDNTIAGLQRDNLAMAAELETLYAEFELAAESRQDERRPTNVIPFKRT